MPPGATDDGNLLRQRTIGPSLLVTFFLADFFGQLFCHISLADFFVSLGFGSKEWVVFRATCFTFFSFVILGLHIQDLLVKTKQADGHKLTSLVPWQNSENVCCRCPWQKFCVKITTYKNFKNALFIVQDFDCSTLLDIFAQLCCI